MTYSFKILSYLNLYKNIYIVYLSDIFIVFTITLSLNYNRAKGHSLYPQKSNLYDISLLIPITNFFDIINI